MLRNKIDINPNTTLAIRALRRARRDKKRDNRAALFSASRRVARAVASNEAGESARVGDTMRRERPLASRCDGAVCNLSDMEGGRERAHACESAGSREFCGSVYRPPSHPRAGAREHTRALKYGLRVRRDAREREEGERRVKVRNKERDRECACTSQFVSLKNIYKIKILSSSEPRIN